MLTNISWNDETRALYDKYASMGMEFTNLRSLFGVVMTTGKAVISNDPSTDPRRCGIPDGHPPLNSFMGLPLYNGETLVGMIGMANRPGGYNQDFIEYLQPLLTTCAHIIEGYRIDQQRKKAEEALKKSEESLANAQRIARIGNWDWDIVNNRLLWSDEIYRIFGVAPQEFGANYEAFINYVHPEDRQFVMDSVNKALQKKETYSINHRIILSDASLKTVHEQAEVVFSEDGTPLRMCGTIQDVTEQTRMQEALKKSEQQLLQAQKMEAIGQLTGGIAHDFNNILTGIIGYANLLTMKANIDSSIMDYSKNIMYLSERAAKLTQGLLTFSRKQVVSLSPINLNQVIRNFENLLAKLIREDIKLYIDMSKEYLIIMADNGQIEQVIMNLIANAKDAMPEGGRLTISTELVRFDDHLVLKTGGYGNPGVFACLSVSDTGTGMDNTTKKRIFEPFFTTKEVGKGTGLGLSIVYGIVNGHKGSINVYSEPGIGTTFRIYFPLINAEAGKEVSDASEL